MSSDGALKLVPLGKPPVALSADEKAIGIAAGLTPSEVIHVACDSGFRHVVQSDGLAFDSEKLTAQVMIQNPAAFLNEPLGVIMGSGPFDVDSRLHLVFDVTQKKKDALASFGDFVAKVKGSRTVWDSALMIADELFTNGAKNAWPKGAPLLKGMPERSGTVELFAQADGERLVIGCRDSFGEYDGRGVIERIKTCFEDGVANSIRHGTTGAGIGSYMIFDACISYYGGSEKGVQTVVCVALPLGVNGRDLSTLSKNIHLLP